MQPAVRIFLGLFAVWTLLKIPLFFAVAEQTRRHLGEAPSEIRKTLRNRMIGSYGVGALNIIILALTATVAILGSTSFIKRSAPLLVAAFALIAVTVPFGIRFSFDGLHNSDVTAFDRHFAINSPRWPHGKGTGMNDR